MKKESPTISAERSTIRLDTPAVGGKAIRMRTQTSSRNVLDRMELAFIAAKSRTSQPRTVHRLNSSTRPGQHRNSARSSRMKPSTWNEAVEFLTDIDGLPILMRFEVQHLAEEMQSELDRGGTDIRSLLSNTFEKMLERMRGSTVERDDLPKRLP